MRANVELIQEYLSDHDPEYVADTAVFRDMPTGEVVVGPDAIGARLYELYHVAFPGAVAADPRLHAANESAVLEFTFTGKNTGPFAGLGPTDRSVSVPMCVVYDIADQRIAGIRVYYDSATMMSQLGGG